MQPSKSSFYVVERIKVLTRSDEKADRNSSQDHEQWHNSLVLRDKPNTITLLAKKRENKMFNDKFTVSVKGNVTNTESKVLPSGDTVINFAIAVNESYKDRNGNKVENVDYIDCSAYGKSAELFDRFCQRGTRILLENQPVKFGRDKDTGKANGRFNVVVQSFEVLKNGKPKEDNQSQGGYQQNSAPQQQNNSQGGYQQNNNQGGLNRQQPNPRNNQAPQQQYNNSGQNQYMEN